MNTPLQYARVALVAFAFFASAAQAQSAQFTTRSLSIVNLANPTEEVRISPNLLTKIYFPDDVIEEIKSGKPDLFTIEINEAGNEISLRAAAKAGFTDLYVKTTSGREAAFLLKVVTDAQGGPRQFIVNSPSMSASTGAPSMFPTTPGLIPATPSSAAPTTPSFTGGLRAPSNAPVSSPAPAVTTPTASAPKVSAPAVTTPTVTRLTNPMTVAGSSSEPVDYRTQSVIGKDGMFTMYYDLRNISTRPLRVDPAVMTVLADGQKVEFQLLRKQGMDAVTLAGGASEIGAIMLMRGTTYKLIEVSWVVKDGDKSYTYTRSFNVTEMQQP